MTSAREPLGVGAPPGALPRFAAEYRVRFDEGGPDGLIRTSALLGIVQDLAWRHSDAMRLTREWYAERGVLWLVRAIEVHLFVPIGHGETIRAETALGGWRRVLARRRTTVTLPDGRHAATVATDWVMTSVETGRPVRVADEIVAAWPAPDSFEPVRLDRAEPPDDAAAVPVVVGLRDLDPVGHMNNGVYFDLLGQSVAAAGADLASTFPRRLALEYVGAAQGGDRLIARAWPTAGGWSHRLERTDDGATLARGMASAGAAPG